MDEENVAYIHTHTGILFSHKKKEVLSFLTAGMDLDGIMLSEMSDQRRQIPYDFTYMWNLKQKQD